MRTQPSGIKIKTDRSECGLRSRSLYEGIGIKLRIVSGFRARLIVVRKIS